MSEELQIAVRDLSPDAHRVLPHAATKYHPVAEAEALDALRSFASLPAVDLVGVEARVFITGPAARVTVRNEHGKLFASLVPEVTNPAVESSPEQVLTWVKEPAVRAVAGEPAAEPAARRMGWRRRLNSPWALGALLLLAGGVAYLNFAPDESVAGVEYLRANAQTDSLLLGLEGRYAVDRSPGQVVLTVTRDTVQGATFTEGGGEDPLYEHSFRPARRTADGTLVLVLNNGAVLEVGADGVLHDGETSYPRLKAAAAR